MFEDPSRFGNVHGFDLTDWPPAKAIWLRFNQDCPQFGVSGTEHAFSKFVRTYRDELHAAGVVVRLRNSTWLGHPIRFREAIAAKLSGQSLSPLRRALRSRSARAPLGAQPVRLAAERGAL